MHSIWNATQKILERSLSPGLFQVWIKPLDAEVNGAILTLSAPNEFVASWVRERLTSQIVEAASQVMGQAPHVAVIARAGAESVSPANYEPEQPALCVPAPDARVAGASGGQTFRFSFDQFVVGPSNAWPTKPPWDCVAKLCQPTSCSSAPGRAGQDAPHPGHGEPSERNPGRAETQGGLSDR